MRRATNLSPQKIEINKTAKIRLEKTTAHALQEKNKNKTQTGKMKIETKRELKNRNNSG